MARPLYYLNYSIVDHSSRRFLSRVLGLAGLSATGRINAFILPAPAAAWRALLAKTSCLFLALVVFLGGPALGGQETAAQTTFTADFSGIEFGDFKYLVRFLSAKGPDFPVSRRLRAGIQEDLKSWTGQEVPERMRREITDDLNAALSDRSLFREIQDWCGRNQLIRDDMLEVFSPEDGRLMRWLVRLLETEGIFDPQRTDISPIAGAQLRALNRILLMGISHKHLLDFSEEPRPPIVPLPGAPHAAVRLLDPTRLAMLQPERVASYLGIRPGMAIADIGAGYGVFTFPLADALKNTGRIYATDISTHAVSHLKTKAESGGYKNVTAVLVKPDGVDPFYKQHIFDMILLVEAYADLINPIPYFDGLRHSLEPTIGRLCIIQTNIDPDFTELEFDDFQDVLKTLAAKGGRFPVCKRMSPGIRRYLKSWQGQEVPAELRRGITDDLNAMLQNKSLFQELEGLHDESAMIGDDHLAMWLVAQLRAEGVFTRGSRSVSPLARLELHRLNRILLTRIFKTHVWRDTLAPDSLFISDKKTIVKQLSAAGYALIRDNDAILPYFHILEFKLAR